MRIPNPKRSWHILFLTGIILLVANPAYTLPSQVDDREQGLRLLNLKRYQDAEKRFSKVLQENPSNPDGYHFRGMARLYQNNLPGATKDFQKALNLAPADTDIMASLGKAHFQSGQTAKAIKILDKAVKTDPENHKAVNQLAWVLAVTPQEKFRNGTRAVMLAKRLVTQDENIHTLDTLAAAYAANKQYKKAVSIQEKAIAILVNRSLTSEMGPYMERLKTYRQNKSWQYQASDTKLSAKAIRKPSDEKEDKKVKPDIEKPIVKKSVKEKPVVTQNPKESSVVAKAEKTDPKVAKTPPAAKLKVEKPVAKLPAADDLTAKPPPTQQDVALKDETAITNEPLFVKKRPASLLAKKRLKKNKLPKKELSPFYPYTIQIASFRDGEKAFFIANHLRQQGDPAYTGPVTLDTSGKWHRVLLGWHTSAESAQKQLDILMARQFREPAVVRRPYAVLVESSKDMNRLERIERRLKELGQLPYRISDRAKKGYWRMLVGAYSDQSIPADLAEMLRQNGFQPVMVMR